MIRFLTKGWILFMLVVLGLSLVGVGYTLWNKQQQIEGVIGLNNIDVAKVKVFTNDNNKVDDPDRDADDIGECVEPDGDISLTSCDPMGVPDGAGRTPRLDKDIATCTASIDEASTGEKMVFHIFKGYPSYYCAVWFNDHNVGTVPVKLQRIKVSGLMGEPAGGVICPSEWYDIDADQDGEADANVHIEAPLLGQQLDPSDILTGQVDVHVKQGAPQGKAFSFLIELIWTTWSEFDPDTTGCTP